MQDKKPQVWIFLRGLMRGSGHFGDFPKHFQQSRPDDFFYILDVAGNGLRSKELSPLTIDEMVEDLRRQFLETSKQAMSNQVSISIVASSLGGMVAAAWARQYPQEVKQLFLINTSAGNLSPFWHRLKPQNYPGVIASVTKFSVEESEKWILDVVSNSVDARKKHLPQWTQFALDNPSRGINLARQLWAAARFKVPQRLQQKVVLLGSPQDRLISFQCTQKLASLWQAEVRVHEWGGHDLMVDDPAWIVQQLL